jgi:4-hydroxythreonine-4-phosphate dehydrogenase
LNLPDQFSLPKVLRPVIAITCGEPAGIGPEISIRAVLQTQDLADFLLIGDALQITALAEHLAPGMVVTPCATAAQFNAMQKQSQCLYVLDSPVQAPVVAGKLDARNGAAVIQMLDLAIDAARERHVDAIVTAPVQKSVINDAGIAFTGHTEYLAAKTDTDQVVMMLAGGAAADSLRVALATTHLALKDVPSAIQFDSLLKTITIIHHDLQQRFGIASPRILVAGLNPHAGEGGYLGREEIDVITPVIKVAQALGWKISGPYPADTLFQEKYLKEADCVLAMYHDQGLPVLKHASFGRGVNITLGLPIIRTSVDHGTALDLAAAGSGNADCGSMIEAIRVACQMAIHLS